jgi:hypothetical protein
MVRRLKTYQTSAGFFDLAVAAPSMRAAAEAWGSKTSEFKRGFAKETHDPSIVATTLLCGRRTGSASARTKVALQTAKQRGVRLGRTGAEILAPKYHAEALDRAKQLEPVIREMQNAGYSIRRMATELTNRKVKTPRIGTHRQ